MTQVSVETQVRRLEDLPSPKGLPLLGNALQLDPSRLHLILENWCAQLGESYTFGLGPKRIFVSSNPEYLQTALRERPERYRRYSPIEEIIAEMGFNGVFSVEGDAWRPQRRLIMHALASTNFRAFFPTMQSITERLRCRWQRAADAGDIVQMTEDLVRYTVDVTTALSFGEDPNTIDQPGDLIQDHLARIFPMINSRVNAPLPLWRFVKLPKDRRFERSLLAVSQHIEGLISRARQRMHDKPAHAPRNLLEAMLKAAGEPGSGITDPMIAANVMTLLLAGVELRLVLSMLARNFSVEPTLDTASATELLNFTMMPSTMPVRLRPLVH